MSEASFSPPSRNISGGKVLLRFLAVRRFRRHVPYEIALKSILAVWPVPSRVVVGQRVTVRVGEESSGSCPARQLQLGCQTVDRLLWVSHFHVLNPKVTVLCFCTLLLSLLGRGPIRTAVGAFLKRVKVCILTPNCCGSTNDVGERVSGTFHLLN